MSRLTDQELIEELKARFEINRKALHDLQALTGQLEHMNRRLQESEAMKSHFLSNIRNEINNPLTAILGLSRHLMGGPADKARAVEVAGMIYAEAFDLDFQLRNIFIAAELEAGERHPDFSQVDIGSLVANTVELLMHHAEARQVQIRPFVDSVEPLLHVTDAQMLQVMIINLLMNAVEYSRVGGTVEIDARRRDGRLLIAVRDSGVGIDPVDLDLIFDRFRQMESGTTKSHRGHGLGLSIVKALVELLDGEVTVKSARGEGAEFTLLLPPPPLNVAVEVTAQDGNFFLFNDGNDEGESEVF